MKNLTLTVKAAVENQPSQTIATGTRYADGHFQFEPGGERVPETVLDRFHTFLQEFGESVSVGAQKYEEGNTVYQIAYALEAG